MKSKKPGKSTSQVELHTSSFGIWLLVHETEYFLPYIDFPWFKDIKLSDLYEVELHHKDHLYWPSLDIDLDINSFNNLKSYPLIAKNKFQN